MTFPIPADSPPLRFVGPLPGGIPTNVVPLAVSDLPEVRETEPNDTPAQANRVPIPAVINGAPVRSAASATVLVIVAGTPKRLTNTACRRRTF